MATILKSDQREFQENPNRIDNFRLFTEISTEMPKKINRNNMRLEHELPASIADWGWKYHHIGIPTILQMPEETYIPHLKFHVSGFSTSPFGIEWMRFDHDSPFDKLIQTVPHIAFEVSDLDYEIKTRNLKVITESNSPADGIKVAMIEHNGAPIELIEFEKNK